MPSVVSNVLKKYITCAGFNVNTIQLKLKLCNISCSNALNNFHLFAHVLKCSLNLRFWNFFTRTIHSVRLRFSISNQTKIKSLKIKSVVIIIIIIGNTNYLFNTKRFNSVFNFMQMTVYVLMRYDARSYCDRADVNNYAKALGGEGGGSPPTYRFSVIFFLRIRHTGRKRKNAKYTGGIRTYDYITYE